jgi:hypothetical protein
MIKVLIWMYFGYYNEIGTWILIWMNFILEWNKLLLKLHFQMDVKKLTSELIVINLTNKSNVKNLINKNNLHDIL